MSYYTQRPVKGTGTGGQAHAGQPKVQETLAWIRAFRAGAILPSRNQYPASHHVADEARQIALADGLLVVEGRKYVRTSKM
jgi:hypothetical protein